MHAKVYALFLSFACTTSFGSGTCHGHGRETAIDARARNSWLKIFHLFVCPNLACLDIILPFELLTLSFCSTHLNQPVTYCAQCTFVQFVSHEPVPTGHFFYCTPIFCTAFCIALETTNTPMLKAVVYKQIIQMKSKKITLVSLHSVQSRTLLI
jgi:hypothetical protein